MRTKYGMEFSEKTANDHKKLMINMIFKLLYIREDGHDWQSYLKSLIIELHGFKDLFENIDELQVVRLLSKLEGLNSLTNDDDFYFYRKTVLECTNSIK